MPLDPQNLTPIASLNNVRFTDLPGLPMGAEVAGKTVYELLSLRALCASILDRADALGLDDGERAEARDLPRALERRLSAGDAGIRSAAGQIVERFGRRLGYLVATLKRGDEASRQARPDWDDSYWHHWSHVRRIWLGGGLVSGRLGQGFQRRAAAVLAEAGVRDCHLSVASSPALLPLIGAARNVPVGVDSGAVLDFGQTAIKRGIAHYNSAGELLRLDMLPPLAAPASLGASGPDALGSLAEEMAGLIAETLQRDLQADERLVVASVASYLRDNHPLARQGGPYASLHSLTGNLGGWLSERVSERAGPVRVTLLHDGTAAARTFAGEPDAAVVTLGTALGAGFPPASAAELRPIAPGFSLAARPD